MINMVIDQYRKIVHPCNFNFEALCPLVESQNKTYPEILRHVKTTALVYNTEVLLITCVQIGP